MNFSMPGEATTKLRLARFEELGNRARMGTNIKYRRSHAQKVVDLTRMHEAHEGIPHNHNVQIRSGKRAGEFTPWLVRNTKHVRKSGGCSSQIPFRLHSLNAPELAPTAHETKDNLRLSGQRSGSLQYRIQRMTR